MKYAIFVSGVILIISITGCQTLTAPSAPNQVWNAPNWIKQSNANDPTWKSLREQKIDVSKPLTLTELIDIGLLNNPSTRKTWEDARAKVAQKKQAESKLYPKATLSADVTREETTSQFKIDDLNYGPAVNLTYLLLDFGGRGAAIEEASQNLIEANFQFNQSIQDLLFNIEKSYYDLYSAQSALEAAESDIKNARKTLYSAEQRFQAGLASKLDVLQAKSNFFDTSYSLEDARNNVKAAQANLAETLGLPADARLEIVQPSKEIPTKIKRRDVTKLIEEALDNRPDIAALRASLRSKEAAVKVANSSLWPTLNAEGSGEKTWYKYYGANERSEVDHGYRAGVTFKWDIFDGFYNFYKKRQAEAERDSQRASLMQEELNASVDVWTKYYNFKTSIRKLRFSKAFLNNATASYELASEGYNAGLKDILDLLKAQSDLSDARSKLIQSKRDLFVSLVDLAHATGSLGTKEEALSKNIPKGD